MGVDETNWVYDKQHTRKTRPELLFQDPLGRGSLLLKRGHIGFTEKMLYFEGSRRTGFIEMTYKEEYQNYLLGHV